MNDKLIDVSDCPITATLNMATWLNQCFLQIFSNYTHYVSNTKYFTLL